MQIVIPDWFLQGIAIYWAISVTLKAIGLVLSIKLKKMEAKKEDVELKRVELELELENLKYKNSTVTVQYDSTLADRTILTKQSKKNTL